MDEKMNIVPALRVNNRSVNQQFLEENLGFKTYLEDAAFAEFGDLRHTGKKLMLIESPSMRTRAVKGLKKLNKIVIRVENPAEIETLLARGAHFSKLYKGANGYAFESISPENDCFLLHAEEDSDCLVELLPPVSFQPLEGFTFLTEFTIEKIVINTPDPDKHRAFYESVLPNQQVLSFQKAQGEDLLEKADATWDLDSLWLSVEDDMDWKVLEEILPYPYFKDKKERFLQTRDTSQIELWFEK